MALYGENTVHMWANVNIKAGQEDIRDSFNMTSLTETNTGRWSFYFSTNAANNDYAVAAISGNQTGTTTAPRQQVPDNTWGITGFRIRNFNCDNNSLGVEVNDSCLTVICCADT